MDILAVLILWKAIIILIALGGIAVGVGHHVRTRSIFDIVARPGDRGSRAKAGPVLKAGPTVGWYVRAVDWRDAEI